MLLDDRRHLVGEAEQFFFVPDRIDQFLEAAHISGLHRVVAVQAVGNGPVRHDRWRRLKIVEGDVARPENVICAPRREHKRGVRRAVDVEVVAVAGVSIPVADEHFNGPEGQEVVEINGRGEGF